jgi:hypothetical protein
VLDAKSRQLVPAANWNAMIKALQNPTTANLTANPPVLMSSLWNSELNGGVFASKYVSLTGASPASATQIASHIKVYQRCYYLNAPKNQ